MSEGSASTRNSEAPELGKDINKRCNSIHNKKHEHFGVEGTSEGGASSENLNVRENQIKRNRKKKHRREEYVTRKGKVKEPKNFIRTKCEDNVCVKKN